MRYSASTRGWYEDEGSAPSDAIAVPYDEYRRLIDGNTTHDIVPNESGYPVLASRASTLEQLAAFASMRRSELLAATDWLVIRAMERGEPVPPEWVAYRQAVRDIDKQAGFPRDVKWPVPPA